MIDLIDTELFDIVAHVDVIELNPPTVGSTAQYYRDVAEARSVRELNAGRVFPGY